SMGKTIFISSHILTELAELCDSVTIIDRGQVKFSGPMEALLNSEEAAQRFTLKLQSAPEDAAQQLGRLPGILTAAAPEYGAPGEFDLELDAAFDSNNVLSSIIGLGIPIVNFSRKRRQLNQAFMDLTSRGVTP
ncbi:MAG: ABC transporter ATP-binding protein, partial [Planctomycetaceae bacterium]|nr:ABC transporter ATP-binding protein [Planctomycetaceae bacterium]